jgi:uncharacterized protein (TIGR04255 family)
MSTIQTAKGKFEPVHSAHSIEQVILAFATSHPLNDEQMLEMRNVSEAFKEALPGHKEIQTLSFPFQIGAAAPLQSAAAPVNNGRVFSLSAPDGTVEKELRIDRTSVSFIVRRYTRWAAVWEDASRYFSVLAPIYAAAPQGIKAVSLNIVDKFVWQGDISEAAPDQLLSPESKYLSPHIFKTSELWHSHTGVFIHADSHTKRLLNVNVDCLDEDDSGAPRRVIAITMVLNDMLNEPSYDASGWTQESVFTQVESHFEQLHACNKDVLSGLINDKMAKRIALGGN